jgi:hypothetical protein
MFIIVIGLVTVLAYFLVRYSARMIFGLNLLETGKKKRTYIDAQDEIRESVRTGADAILYCPTRRISWVRWMHWLPRLSVQLPLSPGFPDSF